ncbi:MAG: hypothetical protein AAF805_10080 [Planctomycetota bacterium]
MADRLPRYGVVTLVAIGWLLTPAGAWATVIVSTIGEPITIGFDAYSGTGVAPGGGGGTLDSDQWNLNLFNADSGSFFETGFGGSAGAGVFGRGTSPGGVDPADFGFYAFEVAPGDIALGTQPGPTDFSAPGIELRLENQTGFEIDFVEISYTVYVRNDSDESLYVDLEFSDGGVFIDPFLFDTPIDADTPADFVAFQLSYDLVLPLFSGFGFDSVAPVAPGGTLDVRWSIGGSPDLSGGYDEVAIDNIRITAFSSQVPEPTAAWVAMFAVALAGRRREPSPSLD